MEPVPAPVEDAQHEQTTDGVRRGTQSANDVVQWMDHWLRGLLSETGTGRSRSWDALGRLWAGDDASSSRFQQAMDVLEVPRLQQQTYAARLNSGDRRSVAWNLWLLGVHLAAGGTRTSLLLARRFYGAALTAVKHRGDDVAGSLLAADGIASLLLAADWGETRLQNISRQRFERAIALISEQNCPNEWAACQFGLGAAPWLLPGSLNKEELEQSVRSLEAARANPSAVHFYGFSVRLHCWLGAAYWQLSQRYNARLLDKARTSLNAAKRCVSISTAPRAAAAVLYQIAIVSSYTTSDRLGQSMDRAIALLQQAAAAITRDTAPDLWTKIQSELGRCLRDCSSGDPFANNFRAATILADALGTAARCKDRMRVCNLQMRLGCTYASIINRGHPELIEQGIMWLRRARQTANRLGQHNLSAAVTYNLGFAYLLRERGRASANVKRAIDLLESLALDPRLQQDAGRTEFLFFVHFSLGQAYSCKKDGDRRENLRRSLEWYSRALDYPRQRNPIQWLHVLHCSTYPIHELVADPASAEHREVLRRLECVVRELAPEDAPDLFRQCALELGLNQSAAGEYGEALRTFQQGIICDRRNYTNAFLFLARSRTRQRFTSLYLCAGWCLAQMGQALAALEIVEEGRDRWFNDALINEGRYFTKLSRTDQARLHKLAQSLRRLESEQRSPSRPLSDIIKETEEIHTVISSEIRRIQEANPGFAATGLTAADLSTAIPDETTACVLFAVTSLGTILFLLHREGLDARCEAVLNSRFTARNLIAAHRRWVLAYQKYRMEPRGPAADEAWGRAINRIMDGLSRELFVPVTGRLSQIRPARILLVPHGALHLFPLHLLRMPSGGRTRPLIDFCEVALAPRLKLPRRHSESTGPRQAKFVGIANPTLDLHWADHEVQAISQLFGANARILSGIQATKENVLSAVQHAKYIHFACHGSHDLTQPFASSLILSPFSHRNTAQPRHNPAATTYLKTGSRVTLLTGLSAPWTLNDMFAELKLDEPELVVLSACESGAGLSSTGGEDFIGLSTAFLHCGARNVVASSWIVDDEWASALMERFYTLVLTQGLTASAALRAAQLWLRDGMGQGNPAIWAAFHVTGK